MKVVNKSGTNGCASFIWL